MYRALAVANYLRDTTTLDPAYIKSSGRGEYVPIADNATPEGRARLAALGRAENKCGLGECERDIHG